MRNYNKVLTEILAEVPKDEIELIKQLEWHIEDGNYKAPEETLHWRRVSETLGEDITPPTKDWEFKVLSIFSTLPLYEVKKYYERNKIKR